MIKLNRSKPIEHVERLIATGVTVGAEGVPLISTLENGEEKVTPATGAGGEIFVGFSWMHNITPTVASKVETITVPGTGETQEVYLQRNNIVATQISIMKGATQLTEVGGAPAADQYNCDDATGKLTFNVAEGNAGDELVVTYRYSPTTLEVEATWKHPHVNINPAFAFLGSLGVITMGEIFTDQFDASVDWSAAGAAITLGAGILDVGGAVTIDGHVTHVPTADNPYLGIKYVAA